MAFNIVQKIDDKVQIKNVLISLFDKTGLDTLVNGLIETCPDVKIYSTGGTYKAIKELLGENADKYLVSVSDYTGQPEMQGGLVKTLDFKIYLGILGEKYNEAHQGDLARTNAVAFDMVVEQDCRIKFEMYQGGKKNYIIPYEINAKSSEVNRVRIKITDGWVWEQGSKIAVFLDLKNPLQVRETKYRIGNMVLDIEKK
jgi:hypothetical protein